MHLDLDEFYRLTIGIGGLKQSTKPV